MRFKEFANPKHYTQPTVVDAEHFLKQTQRFWPDGSDDELAPTALRNRRKPLEERKRLIDAMSEC